MFCTNCGASINVDAIFCSKCGNKIWKDETQPPSIDATPATAKPKQGMKPMHYITIGVLAIVVIFGGMMYFNSGGNGGGGGFGINNNRVQCLSCNGTGLVRCTFVHRIEWGTGAFGSGSQECTVCGSTRAGSSHACSFCNGTGWR